MPKDADRFGGLIDGKPAPKISLRKKSNNPKAAGDRRAKKKAP